MMSESYYIRLEFEARVDLPEGSCSEDCPACISGGWDRKWEECKHAQRAVDALMNSIPQSCQVFLDGPNNEPCEVSYYDLDDGCVQEVRCE